jgi:hypothetical protein
MKRLLALLALCSLALPSLAQIQPLFHQYEHVYGTLDPFVGDVQGVGIPKFNTTGKTLQYVEFTTDVKHRIFNQVKNRSCTTAMTVWFGDDIGASGDAPCISVVTFQVPSGSWLYDSAATYPLAYLALDPLEEDFSLDEEDRYGIVSRFTNPNKWAGMTGTSGDWTLTLTHTFSGGYGDTANAGTTFPSTLNSFGWPTAWTSGCQETRTVVNYDAADFDVYVNYTYTIP